MSQFPISLLVWIIGRQATGLFGVQSRVCGEGEELWYSPPGSHHQEPTAGSECIQEDSKHCWEQGAAPEHHQEH